MLVNGRDPEKDGWILVGLTNWRGGGGFARAYVPLPDVRGVIPASQLTASARVIRATYRRYLTSLGQRDDAFATLSDLHRGQLTVRMMDSPNRVIRCEAFNLTPLPVHETAIFASPVVEASVDLICYDGTAYDADPRIVALSTTPTEIPCGDLTMPWRLTWGGAWTATTSRTLIYRDAGGVARTTMTVTAPTGKSLGSTDHLELDRGYQYLTKVASAGTRTASEDWFPTGDWITLDPAFQDRAGSRYGTLEISAGTAQIVTRRAWGL